MGCRSFRRSEFDPESSRIGGSIWIAEALPSKFVSPHILSSAVAPSSNRNVGNRFCTALARARVSHLEVYFPTLTQVIGGDAVRLARELFFILQAHAKPPATPDKMDSFFNKKQVWVPVEVQSYSFPKKDTQMMRFDLNEVQIEVDIVHKPGQPDEVSVVTVY
jgi:hypothetical protein